MSVCSFLVCFCGGRLVDDLMNAHTDAITSVVTLIKGWCVRVNVASTERSSMLASTTSNGQLSAHVSVRDDDDNDRLLVKIQRVYRINKGNKT